MSKMETVLLLQLCSVCRLSGMTIEVHVCECNFSLYNLVYFLCECIYALYPSTNIIRVKIRKTEMGRACGTYMEEETCIQGFGG
jgi:hypothetical protein